MEAMQEESPVSTRRGRDSLIAFSTGSDAVSNNDEDAANYSDDDESQYVSLGKRKRPLKTSCELCKARKVKCDREEPQW